MTTRYTGSDRIAGSVLDLRQVSHKFECDGIRRPILEDVSLRIGPGDLVALLGPGGCGKSTLLRLIAGLVRPSAGTILLDGVARRTEPHLVLSKDPGLSAQDTVHAQVSAARDNRRSPEVPAPHVDQALRLLGLNRFAGACPRELTAGTAQRVSLATALVNDPRLLLLDDPFSRLDPITRAAIQNDLLSLWQRSGFTALFATNDVDEALSVASRVIVLRGQPARIAQDLVLDCEFPRRPADPCLAEVRRALLYSLNGGGGSQSPGSLVLRAADTVTRTTSSGAAIALRGVAKAFGVHHVLHCIDLDIDAGTFVAIVGRSGCGKSALLRLLAGLDRPTGGSIAVDRQARGWQNVVRLMFQEPRLLPWQRVTNNVEVGLTHTRGKRDRQQQAEAALAQVNLRGRGRHWPAVLSGGQKQRVALARALVSHPRLLLLDEPLGALDALTRIEMQDLVETVWRDKGFTAIVVTHDVSEAVALADRILLLEDGKVALDVAVDLPRPRRRGDPRAASIEGRILERLLRR